MEDLIATFPNDRRCEAEAVVRELVDVGARFRALHAQQLARRGVIGDEMEREREAKRAALYAAARNGAADVPTTIAALRALSLAKMEDAVAARERLHASVVVRESALDELQRQAASLLARCAALMRTGDPLSWRLRYVCEVDPFERGAALQLGGAIVDAAGRNLWSDYCGVCYAEIATGERRLRCFECDEGVICAQCDASLKLPGVCSLREWETAHPVLQRLEIGVDAPLGQVVRQSLRVWAHRPCMSNGAGAPVLTYRDVEMRARRFASLLRRWLCRRVAICLPNCVEWYVCDIGAVLAGVTTCGVYCALDDAGKRTIAATCDLVVTNEQAAAVFAAASSRVLIVHSREWDDAVESGARDSDDDQADDEPPPQALYTIFWTSGSTGAPKGVLVTRAAFAKDVVVPSSDPASVYASFVPCAWGADRMAVYQSLYNGGRVGFIADSRAPSLFAQLRALRPTFFFAPPMVYGMLNAMADDSDLLATLGVRVRVLGTGGAPIGDAVVERFKRVFHCEFAQGYGITECGGIASNGRLLPNVAVRIVDAVVGPAGEQTGRCWIKHRDTMTVGYLDREDLTRAKFDADGFFDTGDICCLSRDGRELRVVGRADHSAIKLSNGQWFAAEAMENTLAHLADQLMVHLFVDMGDDAVCAVLYGVRDGVDMARDAPVACVVACEPLPCTVTSKLLRSAVLAQYGDAMRAAIVARKTLCVAAAASERPGNNDALRIARELMPGGVDASRSLMDNGASSMVVAQFVQRFGGAVSDWRALLHTPLASLDDMREPAFDALIDADLRELSLSDVARGVPHGQRSDVFLTGATGFCGAHLLHSIITTMGSASRRVFCLVRGPDGGALLLAALRRHGLVVSALPSWIVPVSGSVDSLPPSIEALMESTLATVYHLAARVDFRDTYASARATNVVSTQVLAAMCARYGVRFVHASSLSAQRVAHNDGYANSKFVAESIVRSAGGEVVRLPLVLFNGETGVGNRQDWLTRLLASCVRLRVFPWLPRASLLCWPADWLTVDAMNAHQQWLVLHVDLLLQQVSARLAGSRFVSLLEFGTLVRRDPSQPCYPVLHMLPTQRTHDTAPLGGDPLALSTVQIDRHIAFLQLEQ